MNKEIKPTDLDQFLKSSERNYRNIRSIISSHMFDTENYDTFKELPIMESSFSRVYRHIMSGAPMMLISAFTGSDKKENEFNTVRLSRDIIKTGLSFVMFKGHWVVADSENENEPKLYKDYMEKTFMVQGYDFDGNVVDFGLFKDIGIEWCKKYNQYSVLIGKNIPDVGIDFKYYDKFGNISEDEEGKLIEFNELKVNSNLVIDELITEYNQAIIKYIEEHPNYKDDEEYQKLTGKHLGSSEDVKSGINIQFDKAVRENTVIVKNNIPYGKQNIINTI